MSSKLEFLQLCDIVTASDFFFNLKYFKEKIFEKEEGEKDQHFYLFLFIWFFHVLEGCYIYVFS